MMSEKIHCLTNMTPPLIQGVSSGPGWIRYCDIVMYEQREGGESRWGGGAVWTWYQWVQGRYLDGQLSLDLVQCRGRGETWSTSNIAMTEDTGVVSLLQPRSLGSLLQQTVDHNYYVHVQERDVQQDQFNTGLELIMLIVCTEVCSVFQKGTLSLARSN